MPIPDEKARSWTRPEDYWPPRRLARAKRVAIKADADPASAAPLGQSRPFPTIFPYLLLMLSMAVVSIAIILVAWPGNDPDGESVQAASEKPAIDGARKPLTPAR